MLAVTFETVRQLVASGIVNGSAYGLLGVAFALILGVTGRFHYAFGVLYTLSAYFAFTLFDRVGWPILISIVIGVLITVVMGVGIEAFIYRPLAARAGNNSLLAIFVASLGLGVAGGNLIQIFWGAQTHSLLGVTIKPIGILGANVINVDVYAVLAAVLLVGTLTALLRFTGLGRSIKATRSNPDMALLVGVDPARIYLVVFAIASLFAGIAAVFAALKYSVDPTMGFRPVVLAFVVAFLGGTSNSPVRVYLCGVVIGLIETISSIWLSVRWNQLVVFVILVIYLASFSFNRSLFARIRQVVARPA
ncbi:MAG: branched-chain amino acid ABC transporter permease [Ilumatobacter sp.]|uniref:branched-chain amino acid ABC transporter permease n=1 Tax=Ilumatobacter sp. TaxID=1967498 RepID=UPI00329A08B1